MSKMQRGIILREAVESCFLSAAGNIDGGTVGRGIWKCLYSAGYNS